LLFAYLNGFGRLILFDLMTIQRNFSVSCNGYLDGFLNGDSLVNRADLALLLSNYGKIGPAPSPAAGSPPGPTPAAAAGVVQRAAGAVAAAPNQSLHRIQAARARRPPDAAAIDQAIASDLRPITAAAALSARRVRTFRGQAAALLASLSSAAAARIIGPHASGLRSRRP
jgi:hypothetical protein